MKTIFIFRKGKKKMPRKWGEMASTDENILQFSFYML